MARGVDHRQVRNDRVRKSVGAENTFANDLTTIEEARQALVPLIEKVSRYAVSKGIGGRTITLKLKYADFEQITRSRWVAVAARTIEDIATGIEPVLVGVFPTSKAIRLLGVTLSALEMDDTRRAEEQLALGV